jgi:hypothetical protein
MTCGPGSAPDSPPSALLNRWVDVGDGLDAMMSIRYEGEDPDRAFVDATPLNRPPEGPGRADSRSRGRAAPPATRPRHPRLWSAQPHEMIPHSDPDKRFIAAPLPLCARGTPWFRRPNSTRSLTNYPRAQPERRGESTSPDGAIGIDHVRPAPEDDH